MKKNLLLYVCAVCIIVLSSFTQVDSRQKTKIDSDWKFIIQSPDLDNYKTSTDLSKWQDVCIPHTFRLVSLTLNDVKDTPDQNTFMRETGWYKRNIKIGSKNRKYFLRFEGCHQKTVLWINGKKVGENSNSGFTPFIFDITEYVHFNAENQVTVLADSRKSEIIPPDPGPFDYVNFSGLYRDVYLISTEKCHITSNLNSIKSGITITTPSMDFSYGNAIIDIRTEVLNEDKLNKNVKLVQRVVDKNGNVVLKLSQQASIKSGKSHYFIQTGGIQDSVHFWSPENPYLYHVNTSLYLCDKSGNTIDILDQKNNVLGLREFRLDPKLGFILNDKPIELIGFNRHQQYPYIGDAVPNSLSYQDMYQFKQFGFNVVRTAHYPQDDALIEACDELGILVYEEAPTWIRISQHPAWYKNLESAARAMIRNHKNHPSVVIWGAGINHRGNVPSINFTVKQEDPTRLTASQSSRWTGWQCSGYADIFANMNYGPVIWDRHEPLFAMEGRQGPAVIAEYKNDPMKTGMISWTAHAYYTFNHGGHYPGTGGFARGGAMTIFRYPRPGDLFWYPSELRSEPYIYMDGDWTKNLNTLVIYSNADQIKVSVNGKNRGCFQPSTNPVYEGLNHPPFEIKNVNYEEGEIKLVGFKDGQKFCSLVKHTPQKATAIHLIADTLGRGKYCLNADGTDIVVVHAEIVDSYGNVIKDATSDVNFTVTGEANLVGAGENIGVTPTHTENGVASALIRATRKAGSIKVVASAKGLKSASVDLLSHEDEIDMIKANTYPIHDYDVAKVDMGAPDQLLQFGWIPWNCSEGADSFILNPKQENVKAAGIVGNNRLNGVKFSVSSTTNSGMLRWLGEMNVIGRRGYIYGDGLLGINDSKGVVMTISGLKPGKYKLITYHHAPSSNTDIMDPNAEKLKKLKINKIPYANKLDVKVVASNEDEKLVTITEGKEIQYTPVSTANLYFEVKNNVPVKVYLKPIGKKKGVWFNGFEIYSFK